MEPLLKWPGGKRWFTASHAELLPKDFDRYFEPFLGSGAVFFYVQPRKAVLGDLNADLVQAYRAIKSKHEDVFRLLRRHETKHGKRYYYAVRRSAPEGVAERAARFIYLNRTCFNGIYRVNRDGHFNVPKGSKKAVVLATDDFGAIASLLSRARLQHADFAKLVDESMRDDLLFVDPPYTVRHNNNAFVKYNEKLFSWADQERLAKHLCKALRRGVQIVCTNANHVSIRALYRDKGFTLKAVSRYSSISADADSRRRYDELVILGNVEASE